MIYDFEIVQIDVLDDSKIFEYKFKLNDSGEVFKGVFRYNFAQHEILFSRFYSKETKYMLFEFSKKELERIIEITLSLPEFRLRHVVSPYDLSF